MPPPPFRTIPFRPLATLYPPTTSVVPDKSNDQGSRHFRAREPQG